MLRRWAKWLQTNRRAVSLTAVIIIGGLVIAWVLFVPIPDWLATHDVGQVPKAARALRLQTARDAARGRLLTLGAGLFAAGALWFTARNFTLQRRTFELTEQGQVTDRYTKAIEQLGSDKLDVRIGGIYALERVARDSPRDHPTVMVVLAAFVREHSHEPWPPAEPAAGQPTRATRPDVQAAVTVIGRRNPAHDQQEVNLATSELPNADLTYANLARANLGHADLSGATLVHADLNCADLTGADLSGANLCESDVIIAPGIVGRAIGGPGPGGVNLTGAMLGGANLAGANLGGANLNRANFTGANLADANCRYANLTGATLIGANFTGAKLGCAIFAAAHLTGTNFTSANLTNAVWPEDRPVPEGWLRDPDSGRLRSASEGTGNVAN